MDGQNETEQQLSQRTAEEMVVPWQTEKPKFLLFPRSHSMFGCTSYKASFCLENNLPYDFYPDISQEKAEAEEKLMCLKLLVCRPRRCFSKSTCRSSLTIWVEFPEFTVGGERTLWKLSWPIPTPEHNDMHTLTIWYVPHKNEYTHTIMKVLKYICGAEDRTQDPVSLF